MNIQCPRCGSMDLRKNGTHGGRQAWLCRTCSRYFTENVSRREWLPSEIATLKRMYKARERIEDIILAVDKTASAIKSKLSRLKITRDKRPPMKEEHKRMHSEMLKGRRPYEMTDEIRRHMCIAQRKREQKMTQSERDKRLQHMRQIQPKGIQEAAKLRRGQSTWNKGMKPWEWMKMTKEAFFEMLGESQKRRPTRPEQKLNTYIEEHDLPWRYVGDGRVWMNGHNPDFIHINEKKIVEVFGRYWHPSQHVAEFKKLYAAMGWQMKVIWDDELDSESRLQEALA